MQETILIDGLVQLPIGKKKSPPERSSALTAVQSSRVTTKPEVIVAFDAQFEQFIERRVAGGCACANLRCDLIVIALGTRKPMRAKRSAERGERSELLAKLPAGLGLGRGIESEATLRHAHEGSLDAQPCGNRGSAGEEGALGGRSVTAQISKIPIGDLRAGAPAPAGIHQGMRFDSHCGTAHVQVRERRARAKKSFGQIPIFVAGIGVQAQAQAGIAEQGQRKRERGAAFFRIPSRDRGQIHRLVGEIVKLRIDRSVRQAAQERNEAFHLRMAPAVSLR